MVTRSIVFVVIGLALLFRFIIPQALVSLQLLGVSGMVFKSSRLSLSACFGEIQSKEITIAGLVWGWLVTVMPFMFTWKFTFNLYEGFWGLCYLTYSLVVILNRIFAAKRKQQLTVKKETLFF